MKQCSRCKQEKDFSHFTENPRYKDGFQSCCRPCVTEYQRERRKTKQDYMRMTDAELKGCRRAGGRHGDRERILEIYAEAQRLTKETGVQHEVDHIVGITDGGLHHEDNLQILTRTENMLKYNRDRSKKCETT